MAATTKTQASSKGSQVYLFIFSLKMGLDAYGSAVDINETVLYIILWVL